MNNYRQAMTAWKNSETFTHTATFHFTRSDHAKTARHFGNILNGLAFGNAFKRFGRSLTIYAVRQKDPEHSGYHVHFAIGGFPHWCNPQQALARAAEKTNGIWGFDSGLIRDDQEWFGKYGQEGWLTYVNRELEVSDDILI